MRAKHGCVQRGWERGPSEHGLLVENEQELSEEEQERVRKERVEVELVQAGEEPELVAMELELVLDGNELGVILVGLDGNVWLLVKPEAHGVADVLVVQNLCDLELRENHRAMKV